MSQYKCPRCGKTSTNSDWDSSTNEYYFNTVEIYPLEKAKELNSQVHYYSCPLCRTMCCVVELEAVTGGITQ